MAKRPNATRHLDARDRQILQIVQRNAALPQAAIARKVGLSTAAVHERLKKLRAAGVIRRIAALVDPQAVGMSVTAFVEVFLDHPRYEPAFLERVSQLDAVLECHHITGEFSLLLKVRIANMQQLQHLLLKQLGGHAGVRQTRTVLVLSTVKEECYLEPSLEGDTA